MIRKFLVPALLVLCSCGGLETKAALVDVGDNKADVLAAMGTPRDRQMRGASEAWQYCQTGAGFGYHDYRIIWFHDGLVSGMNSYKDSTAGRSCQQAVREIRWEDAPDITVEMRDR